MKIKLAPLLAPLLLLACGSPDDCDTVCAPGHHANAACVCVGDTYDAAPTGEARYAVQMPIPNPSLIKDALDNGATWHPAEGLSVSGSLQFPVLVGDEWFLDAEGSTISERTCEILSAATITPGDADPEAGPAPFTVQWNDMVFALRDVSGEARLTDP